MTFQTRCESLGLTVGIQLIARDTVAVDTRARLATSGIFKACSFARTHLYTRRASNLTRFGRPRLGATSFLTGSRSPQRSPPVVPWSGSSHLAWALDEPDVADHGELARARRAPPPRPPPHPPPPAPPAPP